MKIVSRITSLLLFGFLVTAPAMAAAVQLPERLVENVAPNTTLRQAAAVNPDLAATLASLEEEAKASGRVRVAVKTSVAFAPENLLGDWQRTVQRREIASAAAKLRKSMPKVKDFTALPDMPYVTMTVDTAGLARLASVPGLARIVPEDSFNWMHDFVELESATRAKLSGAAGKQPDMGITPKIVGGGKADPGTHPFQVALLFKKAGTNAKNQFCGGTLVSPYLVVTAAHCTSFVRNPSSSVQVLVGTQSLDQGGQRVDVWRVSMHPSYNRRLYNYDVAVWELATPVTGIPFATLAGTQPATAGTPLRVTGWGNLSSGGKPSPDLLQVDVPFVPTIGGRCELYDGVRSSGITPQMLCAGTGGKDSCQGDSGGPLTIDRGAGYNELVGIVSFGNECALEGYPGVYTNVAESSINQFIRSFVDAPFVPRIFNFQTAAYTVDERARRLTVTVTRTQTAGTATVVLKTAPGTAGSRDFRSVNRKLTFKPGVASVTVPITIVNDRLAEGPESFTVTLSSPAIGFTLGDQSTATVSITDDELAATGQSASR
jgi:secreted trypsin-like serine protease